MNAKLFTGVGLSLVLCACATSPQPNEALETARAAVQTAQADPNVAKYDPLDLEAAKQDLAVAESAAMHHNDAEVSQPAYMAAQTARLAQMRAAAKADDAKVAEGQHERDRIQLAARTNEVNTAVQQRDQANEQASRLQAEIDKLKATPTSRGLVLTFGDVLFDTGKAQLNPGATFKLDQLAQFLNEHTDRRVQIEGFTDSVGSEGYNQELSQRRADAVKAALLSRGVDPSRVSTEGYGKAFPVASNNEAGGRQLNRRVEVVIGNTDNVPIAPRT
jgi:outer membrane protein OmpA-like peptidoglycan-associated protein